jgi:hypothetical protein
VDKQPGPEVSDILTRLSQQAKTVEEAFADLATKTDAAAADRDARVHASWRAMQDGIDKEIKEMQAASAARKREHDVRQAEQDAQTARTRADWAASYAVTASEMARLASLDAEAARHQADALKQG